MTFGANNDYTPFQSVWTMNAMEGELASKVRNDTIRSAALDSDQSADSALSNILCLIVKLHAAIGAAPSTFPGTCFLLGRGSIHAATLGG